MTHPIIEKCARAMIERRGLPPGCDINWPAFHADVIAVLRTLRTPDKGMLEVGNDILDECVECDGTDSMGYSATVNPSAALATFTAMIDSILPEEIL